MTAAEVRVFLKVKALVRVNRLTYTITPISYNGNPQKRGLRSEEEVDAALDAVHAADFSDFRRRESAGWWLAVKTLRGGNAYQVQDRVTTLATPKVFTEGAFRAAGTSLLTGLKRWFEYGGFDPEGAVSDGDAAISGVTDQAGEFEYTVFGLVDSSRNR